MQYNKQKSRSSSNADIGGTPEYEGGSGATKDQYAGFKGEWNEWANVNETINQKHFASIFEFLKAIRYKQKKQKRYEEKKKNGLLEVNSSKRLEEE